MQEGVYGTDTDVAKTWNKLRSILMIMLILHASFSMAMFMVTVSAAGALMLTAGIFNLVFIMGGLFAFVLGLGQNNFRIIISIVYSAIEIVFVQIIWIAAFSMDDDDLWMPAGALIPFWLIWSIYPGYIIFLLIRSIRPGLNPNLIFSQPNKQIITVYKEGENVEFNNIEEGQQVTEEAEISPQFINSTPKQYQINASKPRTLAPQLIQMDSRQANNKESNQIISSGIPISKSKGKYGKVESDSEEEIN